MSDSWLMRSAAADVLVQLNSAPVRSVLEICKGSGHMHYYVYGVVKRLELLGLLVSEKNLSSRGQARCVVITDKGRVVAGHLIGVKQALQDTNTYKQEELEEGD